MLTPGKGLPTEPGLRSPSYGLESAMPISVIPYRSKSFCPVRLNQVSCTVAGSAADPETISRMFLNPAMMGPLRSFSVLSSI